MNNLKLCGCLMIGLGLAPLAQAATCVSIDESRDTLTADERKAALSLAEQAFRDQGRDVATEGCNEIYTLTHARLGESITVTIVGPQGSRQMTASKIEELPDVYQRIVPALLNNTSTDATVTRDSVVAEEAEPERVQADALATLRVGSGVYGGAYNLLSLGGGYRFELDSVAIDLDAAGMFAVDGSAYAAGYFGIGALYLPGAEANSSPYFGAGLGLGFGGTPDGGGLGLQPRLTGGYMFLRATTIRLFVQADVNLPTWTIKPAETWVPSAMLAVGIGYKPMQRTYGVRIF